MDARWSKNLESYARDQHSKLLAEAKKARLVKEALAVETLPSAPRTGDGEARVRSLLPALANYVAHLLS